MMKKLFLASVLCAAGVLPVALQAADENATEATADKSAAAKPVGRLPNYYAKVVDQAQREKIYVIQASYASKIEALQEELKELLLSRDGEIRSVLTVEQQKKLDEIVAAAKSKSNARKKTADEAKTADDGKADEQAAK